MLITLALGVALEVGTLGERTGLPLALLISAAIGYFASPRGWLAPVLIGPAQFAAAFYRGGNLAASWLGPLVVVLVGTSLPALLAAYLGRRLRTRRG